MYRHFTCSRNIAHWMACVIAVFSIMCASAPIASAKIFRAGAFAMDITPRELPVIVNGGVRERLADKVNDPLHARCLVLDDGSIQLAIAVVDNCLIPRSLLDKA